MPSVDSAAAAAQSINQATIPADLRFYIVNEPGAASYYLDEAAWVALSHMRRRVATVFMVLALIGFLWFLSRPPQ